MDIKGEKEKMFDSSGEGIAVINFINETPQGDISYIDDWIKAKHEVYYKAPKSCSELKKAIDDWSSDNRGYLYLAAHGNCHGISREENSELISWKCLCQHLENISLTCFASCYSKDGAEYCHQERPRQSFIGSTGKLRGGKHGAKWIIQFLDNIWKNGTPDFTSHKNHLDVLNKWIELEYGESGFFELKE